MINIGDKFGKLEIIDNKRIKIKNSFYYLVKCECGKIYNVQCSSLKNGKTIQCKSCYYKSKRLIVNIGDKYGEWTVIDNPISIKGQRKCKVQCSCGNIRLISISQLTRNDKYLMCKKCNDGKLLNGFRSGFITKIKRNAFNRKIEFSELLTPKYLYELLKNQNFKCVFTNDNLLLEDMSLDHSQKELNLSLDRIDSNLGYIPGNVQWVTKQVNWCKNTLNNQEFINLCQKVINHANQQPSIIGI